jgi:flagellar biosynthesis protein FlhF
MEIRTYRARSMQEALAMVRRELGPDAAILHTREVRGGRWLGWLTGARWIEVTASAEVRVPSRLPDEELPGPELARVPGESGWRAFGGRRPLDAGIPLDRAPAGTGMARGAASSEQLASLVRQWKAETRQSGHRELPEVLFRLFAELLDAEWEEHVARDLVEQLRDSLGQAEPVDPVLVRARALRLVESEIRIAGPLAVEPGKRRVVALVGPTGVGKTTTIAKLAAHYRLKQRRRVGLITVDTYRIAAVEQLRTYADIIDLPMYVVSTPREMREASRQWEGLDLVLMDTAGRSPRDEIKLQELKAFLQEAHADEVHLVLSTTASARALVETARQFQTVGITALLLTKLDEASALGHVFSLLRASRLPVSYLTNGQNVPEDIEVAQAERLARWIMGVEALPAH